MKSQFKQGRTTEDAVFLFLKKYVQTFDSNHDGIRDARAAAVDSEDDSSMSAAVATAVQSDATFSKSPSKTQTGKMVANILQAVGQSQSLEDAVVRYAHANKILGPKTGISGLAKKNKQDLEDIEEFIMDYKAKQGEQTVKAVEKRQQSIKDYATPTKGKGLKKGKRVSYVGRGIQTNNISDKIYVDITHLNKDSLCLKYKSTKKIIGKPQPVTQDQKDSIMAILKGDYTKKQYDKLRSEDKELIHDFAVLSKAKGVKFITQTDELLNKLHVILGEISAGNSAESLLVMLEQTTKQLMKNKGISRLEGLSILNQIEIR
jgi:hypothetical protein